MDEAAAPGFMHYWPDGWATHAAEDACRTLDAKGGTAHVEREQTRKGTGYDDAGARAGRSPVGG